MSALKTEVEAKFASTFSVASTALQIPMNKELQSRCGRVEANSAIYFSEV